MQVRGLLLAAAGLIASCGGGTAGATDTTPRATSELAATDGAGVLTGAATVLTDKKNDLVDEDGGEAPRNPHVDITKVEARADGTDLIVSITLAGGLPDTLSSLRQELTYLFVIEADDSGEFDYWMTVENREDGHWSPSLTDWATSQSYFDDEYPGSYSVDANAVMMRIPLWALGSPSRVRLQAISQRADHESGEVVAEDQAPEGEQYRPSADWLAIG
jgi:hypothetical protein